MATDLVHSIERRLAGIDTMVFLPRRLSILAALDRRTTLTFSELQKITDVTEGNLHVHIQRLECRGWVTVEKDFSGGRSRTEITLLPTGRQAITEHLDQMSRIVRDWRERQMTSVANSRGEGGVRGG